MAEITIRGKTITSDGVEPYVVAEIGCNHCGDFDLCLKMIRTAAECGADAVKLQKRSNHILFTQEALNMPYESPHSYGKTYGEHREALDWFGWDEFLVASELCHELGMAFIATPFTDVDAQFLGKKELQLDAFKIASCDLTNIPLIKSVSKYRKPMIISIGGGRVMDVLRVLDVTDGRPNTAILHCVSTYPNRDADLDLAGIRMLQKDAPSAVIGFSCHHPGLLPNILAYMMGARIFEVHFTLNRGEKGTDHGFSVEPGGLRKLCQDLQRIAVMLGEDEHVVSEAEETGFVRKMGKSIYTQVEIKAGDIFSRDKLCLRAPAVGLPPYYLETLLGHVAACDLAAETVVSGQDVFMYTTEQELRKEQ